MVVTTEPSMDTVAPAVVGERLIDDVGTWGIVTVVHEVVGMLLPDMIELSVRTDGADEVSIVEEPSRGQEVTRVVEVRVDELLMVIVNVRETSIPDMVVRVTDSDGAVGPEGPEVEFVHNPLLLRVEEPDPMIPEGLDVPGLEG